MILGVRKGAFSCSRGQGDFGYNSSDIISEWLKNLSQIHLEDKSKQKFSAVLQTVQKKRGLPGCKFPGMLKFTVEI